MCAFLIGRNGVLFWQERVGRLTVASLMRRVFAARRRNRPRRSDRQRLPISERAESGCLLPSWTSALHDVMNLVSHCFSMFYHVQFVCRPRYFMRVWAGDRLPAASGWHSLEIPRPHLVVLSCRVSPFVACFSSYRPKLLRIVAVHNSSWRGGFFVSAPSAAPKKLKIKFVRVYICLPISRDKLRLWSAGRDIGTYRSFRSI
jgi:hypothetical protein